LFEPQWARRWWVKQQQAEIVMRQIISFLGSGLAGAAALTLEAAAQDASTLARLDLTLARLSPPSGEVRIAVFCTQSSYAALKADRSVFRPVGASTLAVTVEDLPVGQCAVLVHHDVDGDGGMNAGLFGIPSEPIAATNNARGAFGPLSWRKAAIALTPGANAHGIAFR
jgi:uncharacterized protein (DUF2141 family)